MKKKIDILHRCPSCREKVSIYERRCPKCETDLSLLSDMKLLPYALFNEGVEKIQAGDSWAALIKLCAAVECGKNFKDGHQVLGELAQSLGLVELAKQQFEIAEDGVASDHA